jgi:hypothetical protein
MQSEKNEVLYHSQLKLFVSILELVLFILAIVLSVLWFAASGYPCDIFKLFLTVC